MQIVQNISQGVLWLGSIVLLVLVALLWMHRRKMRTSLIQHSAPQPAQGITIPQAEHGISKNRIPSNVLKILRRLQKHGYQAYLVGGCIRDLLVGRQPKDFDVATNATPEQVRKIFRNARIIGRRFRLVHILFQHDIVEVATFRAQHDSQHTTQQSRLSSSGRLLRDNVFGSIEDDAIRRDFTMNALYYDGSDGSIIDFINGVTDIHNHHIQLIGEPERRYLEDPVRMLRAVRFAVKLQFTLAETTAEPIARLAHTLCDIPAARLFDESLKLFMHGNALKSWESMQDYQLLHPLYALTMDAIDQGASSQLIVHTLENMDKRVHQDKTLSPAFLYACLLWAPLQWRQQQLIKQGSNLYPALQQAISSILSEQSQRTAIPKRIALSIREIWELQPRLERCAPKHCLTLLEQPRFRAGYDFLCLRAHTDDEAALLPLSHWWTAFIDSEPEKRRAMLRKLPKTKQQTFKHQNPA